MFGVFASELAPTVDGQVSTVGPGGYAEVPRGAVHQPSNHGVEPVRFFFVCSPAMDGFLVEMAQLNESTDGAPPSEALAELDARWDTAFVDLPAHGSVNVEMINESTS